MAGPQMVMYEEEFNQIQTVVDRLVKDANSKVVFIVDKNGVVVYARVTDPRGLVPNDEMLEVLSKLK